MLAEKDRGVQAELDVDHVVDLAQTDPQESLDVRKAEALLAWSFSRVHILQSDIVGFTKCARSPCCSSFP